MKEYPYTTVETRPEGKYIFSQSDVNQLVAGCEMWLETIEQSGIHDDSPAAYVKRVLDRCIITDERRDTLQ